jgi:hypothetical protein
MQRTLTWLITTLIIGLTILIFALHIGRDGLVDDAFITYRYSARLASGQGLTYNDGEKVLGTSTPGYALLLALPAAIIGTQHIPTISLLLSFAATIVLMVSVGWIAFRLSENMIIAAIGTLLVMTSHYTTWAMTTGMEATVFLALFSTSILCLLYRRWTMSTVLFSLLPLMRPEGVFTGGLAGVSLLVHYYRNRKQLTIIWFLQHSILLILPGLCFLIGATLYYGTPIPQSITAKSAGLYPITTNETTELISAHLHRFIAPFFQPFIDIASPRRAVVISVLSLAIMLTGGWWLIRQQVILWIVPAMLLILLMFYAHSATLLFGWYYAHFDLMAVLCFVMGLYAITAYVMKAVWKNAPKWLPVVISLSLFLYVQHSVILENAVFPKMPTRQPPLDAREHDYYQLAEWLAPQLPNGTTIAMPEVGVLGFYLPQVTILDAAGLVSPQAVEYFPILESQRLGASIGAIPRGLVRDYQPDMVITLDFFVANGLLLDTWFQENYTLIYRQADLTIEDGELLIYARNDFAIEIRLPN